MTADMTQALTLLTNLVQQMNTQSQAQTQAIQDLIAAQPQGGNPQPQPPPPAPPATAPIHDLFASGTAFDLSTRTGLSAFDKASQPLPETWNGNVAKLPEFLNALKICAQQVGWTQAAPTGIVEIAGHNIFDNYQSITAATRTATHSTRADDRALQNSKALFDCLLWSISGTLKTQVIDQFDSLLTNDGPDLLLMLIDLSGSNSLQVAQTAITELATFDPKVYKFVIPNINSAIQSLFVRANRNLNDAEKILHIVSIYKKIQQPEVWSAWVSSRCDDVDSGTITTAVQLMNLGATKYHRLVHSGDWASPSLLSANEDLRKDVIALMSKKLSTKSPTQAATPKKQTETITTTSPGKKQPPFARYKRTASGKNGKPHVLDDTREWNGKTFYYCNCPTHENQIHWHPWKGSECSIRKKWKANKDSTSPSGQTTTPAGPSHNPPPAPPGNASAFLAALMATISDDAVKAHIADAINLLSQE